MSSAVSRRASAGSASLRSRIPWWNAEAPKIVKVADMSSVTSTYGANIAFIEELFEKYRSDPNSVSASWREFFRDYQPEEGEEGSGAPAPSPVTPPRAAAPHIAAVPAPLQTNATPLRGAAGKIAQNMEASLSVPTATSVRT